VAAPTLKSVEEEYADRVNFIMVNGDDGRNWPLIQLFGVDAIPHLALLSDQGDVETALIGPMSRNVLRADIDALLAEKDCGNKAPEVPEPKAKVCHDELPFVMYDAFGNRPESRRINFADK
jgi:thioredoxin-like negative regulator of GroEL